MRLPIVSLGFAVFLLLQAQAATAQNTPGTFGPMSPGSLGQGGGQYSDFQKLREEMVQKMKDGSYAKIVQQGRDNVEAYRRLLQREGR